MSWLSSASAFEAFALVTGLAAVILLIRQNIWTWPVGVLYAAVSVWVFSQDRLFGQTLLHVFYVAMNLYGWWYWLYGGARADDEVLQVGQLSPTGLMLAVVVGVVSALALGYGLGALTEAQLAWPDAVITAFSFVAMYLQARKYIESWMFWFVINIGSVALYLSAGLNFYAVLYLVYLGLAVVGFQTWRKAQG